MRNLLQYITAIFLGMLGIIIVVFSQLEVRQAKNQYNKIVDAMNHNTSSSSGCTGCNSVTPASWKNDLAVASMFYTKNEAKGSPDERGISPGPYHKNDGKWNINSGPSHSWGPAPLDKSYPPDTWQDQVAIVESANNLGNALGTLTERKKSCRAGLPIGIALISVAVLLLILPSLSDSSKTSD